MSTTQTPGVSIEDVNLSFGDTHVLKGINLTIQPGEFFAFLGPSGSGKSTLLRAIAGFGPTPTGRILIGDDDVANLPPWKRNVGMVFQSYALWPHMTVAKNVAFGLEERKTPKSEINDRVKAALDLVGLADYAERRPSQLSGGQQQRVALARTVVIEPRVLLLDEPLSNLDANLRVQMRRELRELQQKLGLTTIFVTHDQEEANTTSDRLAVLNDGIIQQVGSPMELYDNPSNIFVANFLGTANILKGQIKKQGSESLFVSEQGTEIPLTVADAGPGSIIFRPQNVTLNSAGGTDARLNGTVKEIEFLGNIIRYTIAVSGDEIVVDHSHHPAEQTFSIADQVGLSLSPDHVTALPV